jgi:hypothetical protein
VHKRLFAARQLPRLSLFYMPLNDTDEDLQHNRDLEHE